MAENERGGTPSPSPRPRRAAGGGAVQRGPQRPVGFDPRVRVRPAGAVRRLPPEDVHHAAGPDAAGTGLLSLPRLPPGELSAATGLWDLQDTSLSPGATRLVGRAAAEEGRPLCAHSANVPSKRNPSVKPGTLCFLPQYGFRPTDSDERVLANYPAFAENRSIRVMLDALQSVDGVLACRIRHSRTEPQKRWATFGPIWTRSAALSANCGKRGYDNGPTPPTPDAAALEMAGISFCRRKSRRRSSVSRTHASAARFSPPVRLCFARERHSTTSRKP